MIIAIYILSFVVIYLMITISGLTENYADVLKIPKKPKLRWMLYWATIFWLPLQKNPFSKWINKHIANMTKEANNE